MIGQFSFNLILDYLHKLLMDSNFQMILRNRVRIDRRSVSRSMIDQLSSFRSNKFELSLKNLKI